MDLATVEWVSMGILALFLAVMVRFGLTAAPPERRTAQGALADIARIAAASWVAEASCIHLYGFYQYDAPWRLFVDVMPALVALIWPFVILSAREVVHALGLVDAAGRPRTAAVFAVIVYDASLVEPIAVRAGLWSWNEPGLWSVPIIGILGWGYFGAACSWLLDRRPWAVLVAAPLATHALLLGTWWGLFRWVLRAPIAPAWAVAVSAAAALAAAWALRARRAPLPTMAPRMAAAALFFALLFLSGGQDALLVAYGVMFALPYSTVTWRGRRG